ncbi:hypothetical protein N825_28510 [Skermanella stibiiresistens SB22]|uniref:DUF2946 domain-containing protein n=1 Tax=Skermanella stibiiresistens SB22 TaxID=1385369 RepID=W9H5D7_9PROT|nr:hypothetical protein N825_28510 [Skermanella stibiiresistens SB22]
MAGGRFTRLPRRAGLLVGAVAFLCQILAFAFAAAPVSAQLHTIEICTASGTKTVTLDGAGEPSAPAGATHDDECPACPLATCLLGPPSAPGTVLPPMLVRRAAATLSALDIATVWLHSSPQARAPPVPA